MLIKERNFFGKRTKIVRREVVNGMEGKGAPKTPRRLCFPRVPRTDWMHSFHLPNPFLTPAPFRHTISVPPQRLNTRKSTKTNTVTQSIWLVCVQSVGLQAREENHQAWKAIAFFSVGTVFKGVASFLSPEAVLVLGRREGPACLILARPCFMGRKLPSLGPGGG